VVVQYIFSFTITEITQLALRQVLLIFISCIYTYASIAVLATLSMLPNSVVDTCTVNVFKTRLDKFWQHQAVKFHFTGDLTGTENRSEEVI